MNYKELSSETNKRDVRRYHSHYELICLTKDKLVIVLVDSDTGEENTMLDIISPVTKEELKEKRKEESVREVIFSHYHPDALIYDDYLGRYQTTEELIQEELVRIKEDPEYWPYKFNSGLDVFDEQPQMRPRIERWLKDNFQIDVGAWTEAGFYSISLEEIMEDKHLIFNPILFDKLIRKI